MWMRSTPKKIKNDPRLEFGLPGVNKAGKVSNGNYVWMSFFYSYLSDTGRAGIVMSSQASSADGGEAKVREAMIKTGDVDVMVAIRGNFFFTHALCRASFGSSTRASRIILKTRS